MIENTEATETEVTEAIEIDTTRTETTIGTEEDAPTLEKGGNVPTLGRREEEDAALAAVTAVDDWMMAYLND